LLSNFCIHIHYYIKLIIFFPMKKLLLLFTAVLCIVLLGNTVNAQTTVFTDDFSTNQSATYTTSGVISSSSWSFNRSGTDWGARRNTSPAQLELTNDASATAQTAGWGFAYVTLGTSFSSPFSATLNTNPGIVTWNFNMRTNRTSALAGFSATTSYGMAYIIAATSNTPNTSGNGYAVVMGGGTNNNMALIRFTGGLQGTRTTIIGFGNTPTALTDYISVRVTYDPSNDNWALYTRDDGNTAFADPASGSLTQIGSATANNTYTGSAMSYTGAYWQGSTTATQTAFFDNVSCTVAGNPTLTLADNGSQPGAGSINQSSTNNILQTFTVVEGNTGATTLSQITIPLSGTYLAADLAASGVKLYGGTSSSFGSATLLSSKTAASTGSGETITFNSLGYSVAKNSTNYFWVTVDVSATANTSRNVSANGLTASNFTFAAGTPTGTVSAGGAQTFAAVTPSIAVTGVSPSAGTINQNSTNNILYSTQLDVTVANATLNSFTVTTAGTYQTSDLVASSFKFWINSANNLTGATQLGSGQTIVSSGNTVGVTGLSQVISSGTTRYILVTCDVAYNANTSRNISITSTAFSNIVFATGNLTGTDPAAAGNTQTFGAVTPSIAVTGLGPSSGSISRGATKVSLYQMSFAVTTNSTDLNSIVVTTGGTYVASDLVASSFKLWYNTANNLATASQIGTSQAIVTSGNTVTFSGLTQNIAVGTTGYVWVTVDIDAAATFSSTINITSTAFSNLTFSQGTLTGTDPAAAGGTQTISPVSSATDYFRTKSSIAGFWASYNNASNWESSPDSSSWITSTLVPTSSAARVIIRNGHTISLVTGSTTIGRIIVENGGIFKDSISTSTIADGTGYDVIVQNGGTFIYHVNSTNPTFSGSAKMLIQSGGILQVTGTGMTASGTGMNSSSIDWETGAICDYNTTNAISSSGVTYFPTATSTIPIFRLSANVSAGAGTSTTFNGVFQVGNGVTMTWSGNSAKIFRNGITTNGTGAMTTSSGTGAYQITGTTAELGGTGGTLTITNANGVTVATGCTATFTGTTTLGSTNLTGTGTAAFAGTSGTISLAALSQVSGFSNSFGGTYYLTGTNTSIPTGTYSSLTVNGGNAQLSGDATFSGTLSLNGTLTVGAHKISFTGSSPNRVSGGIDASNASAEVEFNSASTITLPSSLFTGNINNLTMTGSGLVNAADNMTVSGALTLTNGFLNMGANTLTLGTSTSNEGTYSRSSGTIRGSFRRWISAGANTKEFPLDNGSGSLSMATVVFSSLGTGGTLTAKFNTAGAGQLPVGPNGIDRYIEAPSMGVNLVNIAPQYWTITAGDGLATPTYSIDLTGDGIPSVSNINYIAIIKRPDSGSDWGWSSTNHSTTTGSSSNPVLHGVTFTSFSDFGVGGNVDNLLPVELSAFTSTVANRDVTLNWSTTEELNNQGFDVERKSTTGAWIKLGSVEGHGTVTTPQSYSFLDRNVNSGKFSYRLKQIDYNGNYHYYNLSNEISIGTPSKYVLSQNYPNPFNPVTTISYEIPNGDYVALKVYDLTGKEVASLVNEKQEAGFYSVRFDGAKLSSGVYFYTLKSGGFVVTKKLVLMK
jgi:hypothetical protein